MSGKKKPRTFPVSLSASGAARAEAQRVAALAAEKEAIDTEAVLKMEFKGSPSQSCY